MEYNDVCSTLLPSPVSTHNMVAHVCFLFFAKKIRHIDATKYFFDNNKRLLLMRFLSYIHL